MIDEQKIKYIEDIIKKEMPGIGFFSLIFEFTERLGNIWYITNADKSEIAEALQAILDQFKNAHK